MSELKGSANKSRRTDSATRQPTAATNPFIQRFLERTSPNVKERQPYVGCNRGAKVIYVAGPLTDDVEVGTGLARHYGMKLMEKGHTPVVPHTNFDFAPITGDYYRQVMHCCLDLIHRVDAVFMIPGWEHSLGARAERYAAYATGRTVYYDLDDIPRIPPSTDPIDELCEVPVEQVPQAQKPRIY